MRVAADHDHGQDGGSAAGTAVAVRARSADGRWVRARAERIGLQDGSPRGVAVVIDTARAGDVLPLAASGYQLTRRELEVVRGVLNGLDTRSVAASSRLRNSALNQ
jgi:hypothetical protein